MTGLLLPISAALASGLVAAQHLEPLYAVILSAALLASWFLLLPGRGASARLDHFLALDASLMAGRPRLLPAPGFLAMRRGLLAAAALPVAVLALEYSLNGAPDWAAATAKTEKKGPGAAAGKIASGPAELLLWDPARWAPGRKGSKNSAGGVEGLGTPAAGAGRSGAALLMEIPWSDGIRWISAPMGLIER